MKTFNIVFFKGTGISEESGISTSRTKNIIVLKESSEEDSSYYFLLNSSLTSLEKTIFLQPFHQTPMIISNVKTNKIKKICRYLLQVHLK
jgi:DeoR/GlpR family transcriptional regulator of sugar metabolism